ncbi:MAG: hypothetical protein IH963_08135 [Chloroflexi bacterium]|nr:hypothetical protein [Chloroflexota bacterium]MCH8298254.1 hypothetical protein [Chloroflexota bacterium]MCH8800862.1 hypothetical protein [Chloroflexota bacterium]MCH8892503.1 hypothetical protein [Chloroflexota bacterium]MCH9017435.1 hypothetical protein [Chloroflexota bacterium]
MNGSLQYSALTRLLTLNNKVHDLENRMLAETVPIGARGAMISAQMASGSRIAEIQEEIDRFARASLATCWLGNTDTEDEEYEL